MYTLQINKQKECALTRINGTVLESTKLKFQKKLKKTTKNSTKKQNKREIIYNV